jgi:hypothetical protein
MTIYDRHREALAYHGMSLRDYFAANAPVSFDDVMRFSGRVLTPVGAEDRAIFMSVWTKLRYEYADAMMQHREKPE